MFFFFLKRRGTKSKGGERIDVRQKEKGKKKVKKKKDMSVSNRSREEIR